LRGGQGDVDGLAVVVDADVFGLQLREIDAGDGLAVDDEEEAVAGEEVWEDGAGLGAFDYGVDGVDDGFEAVEALNALDDGGTEVSKAEVRPVMAVAARAKMPVVAWRRKTARAAAPRINESRTTKKVPEDRRSGP